MPPFPEPRPEWRQAEDLAAAHLKRKGYAIIQRNPRMDRFELDLVARKGDTVVFVEVRSRHSEEIGAPEETVTKTKQRHLHAAARRYLARHREPDTYYRFDVIGVVMLPGSQPRITHIEDAFHVDDQ